MNLRQVIDWLVLNVALGIFCIFDIVTMNCFLRNEMNVLMRPIVVSIYAMAGMKLLMFVGVNMMALILYTLYNEQRIRIPLLGEEVHTAPFYGAILGTGVVVVHNLTVIW